MVVVLSSVGGVGGGEGWVEGVGVVWLGGGG